MTQEVLEMKSILKSFLIMNALALAQMAAAADVSGTWKMSIEMQAGTSSPVFVLTQKGETITGNYKGEFGEAPVIGTIKGNDLSLAYRTEVQGVPLDVTYTGTVEGNTMSGKLLLVGFGDGTFKGIKQ